MQRKNRYFLLFVLLEMQSTPSTDALYSQYGCPVLQYVLPRTAVSTAPYCSMYCLVLQVFQPSTASTDALRRRRVW